MKQADPRNRIIELIGAVRGLFHLLREVGTAAHADVGINASMRGVMESLSGSGPRTVSQMARSRPVSRQHIQRIVDDLRARGLVRLETNPDHKASPLVILTPKGVRTFGNMMRKELEWLDRVAAHLDLKDVDAAVTALGRFKTTITEAAAESGRSRRGRRTSKGAGA